MPYTIIEDFRGGQDRRRHISAAPPGTIYELVNAHITRGGEIEKRKAFVEAYDLPAGTFGAASLGGNIYVFGSAATPVGLPAGIKYQRLEHPNSVDMSAILDVEVFDGALYVIAKYTDNTIYHFYNGIRVTFWDNPSVSEGIASNSDIAAYLNSLIDADADYSSTVLSNVITITATTLDVEFSVVGVTSGSGLFVIEKLQHHRSENYARGNFTITGGTSNPGTNKITSITVDGNEVLGADVDWTTSNSETARLIAVQVNTFSDYIASFEGDIVEIAAPPGSGASANGDVIVVTVAGDVTVDDVTVLSEGLDPLAQISQVTIDGVFNAADSFSIVLSGVPFGGTPFGATALTFDTKIYSTAGSLVRFCTINNPVLWQPESEVAENIGAGYINIANHFGGSENLTALQIYQGKVAIFSRNMIQLWNMDADPDQNAKTQILQNTGTRSPQSVASFSSSDVFYLDDTGIRSLKSKDSSNAAISDDVGTPIDTLVSEYLATLTEQQIINANAVIEPKDGRYWLAVGEKIYVFSFFPSSRISAWSTYEPGFSVERFIRLNGRVYARSGNKIYLYGGDENDTYDDSQVTIIVPFLTRKRPGTTAHIVGLDIGAVGAWNVYVLTDPNDITVMEEVGTVDGITYSQGNIGMVGEYTHYALKLTTSDEIAARLINLAVHYEDGHDE